MEVSLIHKHNFRCKRCGRLNPGHLVWTGRHPKPDKTVKIRTKP